MKQVLLVLLMLTLPGCATLGTILQGMGQGVLQSPSTIKNYNCSSIDLGGGMSSVSCN